MVIFYDGSLIKKRCISLKDELQLILLTLVFSVTLSYGIKNRSAHKMNDKSLDNKSYFSHVKAHEPSKSLH